MKYLLHHSVDTSAERYPDHDAMRFQGSSLTYADLARKSTQLANLLRARGIQRGERIGVFMNKQLELVTAIYGIMKAGAAYVPLDPRSPVNRIVDIVQDCGIRAIISEDGKRSILAEVAAQQNILEFVAGLSPSDDDMGVACFSWDDVYQLSESTGQLPRGMEQDLAYIMYTSGSTGKPKGIMHTHYSGLSYVRMSAATYGVTHSDRLSNHSPLHFDMSTFDYLTGPYCGATTIIIPEAYTLFPANLSKLIQDERMTIWYSVPFALIQLLLRGVLEDRDLSSLRWILYGGEPFPLVHLRDLMTRLPQTRVSNVYGPAEVNQCTYYHVPTPSEWPADLENIPLGVIWDNAEGRILTDDDQIATAGEVGELVVRTPTMMRGYWNRPDLNERAFYKKDIAPGFAAIYYRTGDLAWQREDGLYEFVGRKDHQVKVRGYRVELAEVDRVLTTHEAVEQGASYVIKRENGDELGAAVIIRAKQTINEGELLAYLRGNLPQYAVPQHIHILESLPRTATGKVDRRALQVQAETTT